MMNLTNINLKLPLNSINKQALEDNIGNNTKNKIPTFCTCINLKEIKVT